MTEAFWRGRRVFVTGHTGFKGSWLSLYLVRLGAQVHGYSTPAPTDPNLFEAAGIPRILTSHTLGDVRDGDRLREAVHAAAPEVVFHMAAQPLVRDSYTRPVETFAVNVMGTVNILEAARSCASVRALVNITTDKCYESREWPWGYREIDGLGGRDPYSSSKACSELVTAAYRSSYFNDSGVGTATARAGNVIGGGDWATARLIPDFFRAVAAGESLKVRTPDSVRPWQHVLDALSGYLTLAQLLFTQPLQMAEAWNFGPDDEARSVRSILDYLSDRVPAARWEHVGASAGHETAVLRLDSSKARTRLGWKGRWGLHTALDYTTHWYLDWLNKQDVRATSLRQIDEFLAVTPTPDSLGSSCRH